MNIAILAARADSRLMWTPEVLNQPLQNGALSMPLSVLERTNDRSLRDTRWRNSCVALTTKGRRPQNQTGIRQVMANVAASMLTLPVSSRDHMQGSPLAPVILVEYGDYECPFCGQAYLVVKEVQRLLGKQLCFVFRNFPLSAAHPHAEHAAEAAEAAGAQNAFWPMHDTLFENQDALEDENLSRICCRTWAGYDALQSQRWRPIAMRPACARIF